MSKNRILSRRSSAVLALGAGLALGGGLALDAGGAAAQTVVAQQQMSQNWSGYVVKSKSGQSYSSISGSWVQPSVSSNSDGSSAFWVGLGGASDSSQALEQVGTGADVSNGQTTYYAWYELVPAAQQRLSLTIKPGDHMAAKVTVNGTGVSISLTDQTSGQSATKTLQMSNPDTSSAEWIAEAPALETQAGAQILPLADFGTLTFTNATATAGGHAGSLSDARWSVEQVDMSSGGSGQSLGGASRFDPAGQSSSTSASTGSVSSDGSSFTVSYSSDSGSAQSGGGSGSSDPGYGNPGSSDPGYGNGDPGYSSPGYGDPGYGYGDPGGYMYIYPG